MSRLATRPLPQPQIPTRRQLREEDRAKTENAPGFVESAAHAVTSEWAGAWAIRSAQLSRMAGYASDPDFEMTKPLIDSLTEGVDEDLWDKFEDARSLTHAIAIRDQLMDVQTSRQRLSQLGWKGTALRITAGVLDPENVAIGIATGGVGWAAKGGRLARLVKGGLVAAGADTAFTAYLASQNPDITTKDVLFAGAASFALGGTINAFVGHGEASRAASATMRRIEADDIAAAMGASSSRELTGDARRLLMETTTTVQGRRRFADHIEPARQQAIVDDLIHRSGFDPDHDADIIEHLRGVTPEEAINRFDGQPGDLFEHDMVPPPPDEPAVPLAEGAPPPPPAKKAGDLWLNPDAPDTAPTMGKARFGISAIFGKDASPLLRKFGRLAVEDAIPGPGGQRTAASVWAARTFGRYLGQFERSANESFGKWLKATGSKWPAMFSVAQREKFMDEVGRAIQVDRGLYTQNPHINAVADKARSLFSELGAMAQRHEVPGFENFDPNDLYFHRVWSPVLIRKAVARHGLGPVENLFAEAIREASPHLDEVVSGKAAKAMVGTLQKLDKWTDIDKLRLFSSDGADDLAAVLRDEVRGITDAEVESIVSAVKPRSADAGKIGPAKRRTLMAEMWARRMENGEVLGLADLRDTNAERVFHRYARQIAGASATSHLYGAFKNSGDEVIKTFSQLRTKLGNDIQAAHPDWDAARVEKAIGLAEVVDRHIRGLTPHPNELGATAMRRFRSVAHIVLSGAFGGAQIPELAAMAAQAHVGVILRQVPALGDAVRTAITGGKIENPLLHTIERLTGLGTEGFTHPFIQRFDEVLEHTPVGSIDKGLGIGQDIANTASGFTAINAFGQRAAGILAAANIVDAAHAGHELSAANRIRLGLSEKDAKRLFNAIREEAAADRGVFVTKGHASGQTLLDFNPDLWADQEAAALFIGSIERWAQTTIQRNDIGNLHPFMTRSAAKTLLQFRNFMIVSYEKQLLHRLATRDADAFVTASVGLFVGAGMTIAQVYSKSIGKPDREKYLKENMSLKSIAAGAFQKAGWTSFIPSAIDTGLGLGQREQLFNKGATGLSRNLFSLDGNPVVSLTNQAFRGAAGLVGAATSSEQNFDRKDAEALTRLVPFRNVVGIRNMLDKVAGWAPERQKK